MYELFIHQDNHPTIFKVCLVACGSLTSGQLFIAPSRLHQGKAFPFCTPFCRLLRSAQETRDYPFEGTKPLPGAPVWLFLKSSN